MKRAENQEWRNQLILDNALDYAIITADMEGHISSWSSGAEKLFGYKKDEIIGQLLDVLFIDEERAAGVPANRRHMASEHRIDPVERWHKRKDGNYFWASGDLQAFYTDNNQQQGFLKIVRDRTAERHQAEALRLSEERVRLAQEAAGIGAFEIDLDRKTIETTEQFCRLLGLDYQNEIPFSVLRARFLDDHNNLSSQILRTIEGKSHILHLEFQISRADTGAVRWIGYWAEALPESVNNPGSHRILGVLQDITERREAQEKQALLSGELAHRVKNILAIVQSIANQTLNEPIPAPEAKDNFITRISALAKAQDILTHGAAQSSDLGEIIENSLSIHDMHSKRFQISGDKTSLSPQAALSMALALHELSTNAVKYGALSNDTGTVSIQWKKDKNRFCFDWIERGGPDVVKPQHKGFGTKLIARLLPASFSGKADYSYDENGFSYHLEADVVEDVFPWD